MSVIGSNILAGASGQDTGYNLTRSLRFRSSASAYLNRTPASAGNRQTWTWSGWVKRGKLGGEQSFCSYSVSGILDTFGFSSDSLYYFSVDGGGGTMRANYSTPALFRDPSAWYHIVFAVDTTQATASNRLKIYVNGVQQTLTASTSFSQNWQTYINSNLNTGLGGYYTYFDGYMTEVNFIDGQALTPSSFGQTSPTTGVWQPKKYVGTYGTNGFYLPFTDNSALTTSSNVGLGKDFSGNGNYWATNNISITAGATYDSMTDVPTLTSATASNFATLNPTIRPYPSADNILYANLRVTNTVGSNISGSAWGTIPVTSGKWYAECTVTTVGNWSGSSDYIGVSNNAVTAGLGTYNGPLRDAGYTYASNGQKAVNGTGSSYGATYTTGDVIGIALDADAGTIEFYKNGTSQGVAFTSMTNTGGYLFGSTLSNNGVHDWNFGQRPFAYTPPTGFVALNTFNLPTPTIGATASTQANKYMDALTYTGTGASNTLVNGGFSVGLNWTKERSAADIHLLVDRVRGGDKTLISSTTDAEGTYSVVTSFNSNGVTLGSDPAALYNRSGRSYIAWQWNAGTSTVTNTAGSITSTVSANTSSGFSVVTYTGTGANATVGHGLGVAPKMVIVKNRNDTNVWAVYHASVGAGSFLQLASTAAQTSSATVWNSTAPTSTVFSIGTNGATNQSSGQTYVAYCFSEVAGYSKFGSYTGNGSTDGTFVFTGFRPAFVLTKCSSTTGNWMITDDARNPYNLAGEILMPNNSDTEYSQDGIDILSNGFKLRASTSNRNTNGATYIYMAFAEVPQKFSLGR